MNRISVVCAVVAAFAATSVTSAATTCSIHPPKDATDTQLAKLAKVSESDAEKKALAHVKASAKVVGSELQVKDECLVWTLIVKENGKSAIKSVNVDAGTGKVLAAPHGTAK